MDQRYKFPEEEQVKASMVATASSVNHKDSGETLYEYAKHTYPKIMERLEKWQICAKCDKEYQELTNVGKWQCRYHPGRISSEDRKTWTCCGKSRSYYDRNYETSQVKGCLRSDHRSVTQAWTNSDNQRVPKILQDLLNPKPDAIIFESDDEKWIEIQRMQLP